MTATHSIECRALSFPNHHCSPIQCFPIHLSHMCFCRVRSELVLPNHQEICQNHLILPNHCSIFQICFPIHSIHCSKILICCHLHPRCLTYRSCFHFLPNHLQSGRSWKLHPIQRRTGLRTLTQPSQMLGLGCSLSSLRRQ